MSNPINREELHDVRDTILKKIDRFEEEFKNVYTRINLKIDSATVFWLIGAILTVQTVVIGWVAVTQVNVLTKQASINKSITLIEKTINKFEVVK